MCVRVLNPLLLCDDMSLCLQGLLQALGLQQQLVHGHMMLLPLLLQVPLCHLQGLHLNAEPTHKQSGEKHVSTHEQLNTEKPQHADVTTHFSSNILRSCSLFSRQLCLSFSSPNREVT